MKLHNLVRYLVCLLLITTSTIREASQPYKELTTKLNQILIETETPSVAIAYIQHGQLAWSTVIGEYAPGKQATETTLYNIASLTKPVTAHIASKLSKLGKFKYSDQAMNYWIDEDIKSNENLSKLTIEHLISHQSGFPNWRSQTNGQLTFQFEPGQRPGYSGEGFQYLKKVLEQISGKRLDSLAHEVLLKPLNLTDTYFVVPDKQHNNVAIPKGPDNEFGEPSMPSVPNAADDLHITINNYAKLMEDVLADLSEHSLNTDRRWTITHDQAPMFCQSGRVALEYCPSKMGFVHGWVRFDYPKRSFLLQGGGDWGERAMVVLDPKEANAAIVFTNGAKGMQAVKEAISTLIPHDGLAAFLAMQAGQ